MTEVLEGLQKIKSVVEQYDWCRYEAAKDKDGKACYITDQNATQFCLLGYMDRALHGEEYGIFDQCHSALVQTNIALSHTMRGLVYWNDNIAQSKQDVLDLVNKTIERIS